MPATAKGLTVVGMGTVPFRWAYLAMGLIILTSDIATVLLNVNLAGEYQMKWDIDVCDKYWQVKELIFFRFCFSPFLSLSFLLSLFFFFFSSNNVPIEDERNQIDERTKLPLGKKVFSWCRASSMCMHVCPTSIYSVQHY